MSKLCSAFLFFLCGSAVFGQVAGTGINGTISDQTGSPIAGAVVKMIETDRGVSHETRSESSGHYSIPDLPVGPYRLEVSAPGFKTYLQTGIVLQVGNNPEDNVKMEIGQVTENVNVSAAASMVQMEQTSVSQVINTKSIVELPLNGRQPTQLVLISGAAVVAPAGDTATNKNYPSSTTISIGGGQQNGTNYVLDGGDNTDRMSNINLPFPFPDALQEFNVDTNALPARNGTQAGGVVNIITKSGTNSFHGDLFEFVRNGDLNARNFFSASQDTLKRNQFGGTIGGRIIRDKLFFFAGYQGTRLVSLPANTIAYVPTALELAGNFTVQESPTCQSSGKGKTLKNPATGLAYSPTNIIPASQLDPAALKLAAYLPPSTNVCGQVTYAIPTIQNEDQGIGRIDWIQNSKHTVFGRYFIANYQNPAFWNPQNILLANTVGLAERSESITLGDIYTFSPTLLNSFHATFTRRTDYRGPNTQDIGPKNLGINETTYVPNQLILTVSNDFSASYSPGHFDVNTFQYADDLDFIRGAHHFTFGADYIRTQNNLFSGYQENGNFTFNGSQTGDAMADYLIGSLSAFQTSLPQLVSERESIIGVYAQDTYHATSHLTIDAGVRWQPMIYPYDYFHRGTEFSMADFLAGVHSKIYPSAPAGALYYGDPGVPAGYANNRWGEFSPRLGLAWDPKGDGKQTFRVGAGLLLDTTMAYTPERLTSNPPFVDNITLASSAPGGLSNPWTTGYNYPGGNPFPPNGPIFPQYSLWVVVQPNIKPTSLYQWNATYQRQFSGNWLASVSYLGNKTTHLDVGQELNPAIYIPGASTTGNTNQRKVLEQINFSQGQYYGNLEEIASTGNADYNALLLSVNHRFDRNFTLLANYTWSHCISDNDFSGDITAPTFENPNNLRADYGACTFDIRHIFNGSVVATSPVHGNGIWAHILGDWQLAPLVRATSGEALNVLSGVDNSLTGIGLDRPNLVPGVDPYVSSSNPLVYLNPAAFTENATGTFGNLGRDALRGPGALNFDLALSRIFPIREFARLEVRGEAFNVINRVNFIAPATGTGIPGISTSGINLNLSSSTFGRITSAGDPRILQIAMKLYF